MLSAIESHDNDATTKTDSGTDADCGRGSGGRKSGFRSSRVCCFRAPLMMTRPLKIAKLVMREEWLTNLCIISHRCIRH